MTNSEDKEDFGYGDKNNIEEKLEKAEKKLDFLKGRRLDWLNIPSSYIKDFEPSQLSEIVNAILHALIPSINAEENPLRKHQSFEHQREKYPDLEMNEPDIRLELKGHLYVKPSLPMKETSARREPSARFREGPEVIEADRDLLFIVAWHLFDQEDKARIKIDNFLLVPAVEAAKERDRYLLRRNGKFKFTDIGRRPMRRKRDDSGYAFDDNFGKLNRIPMDEISEFLKDPIAKQTKLKK